MFYLDYTRKLQHVHKIDLSPWTKCVTTFSVEQEYEWSSVNY